MVDRTHRELSQEEVARITQTYHAWRGEKDAGEYQDVPGFCKSATIDEITANNYILTPGRYVGAEEIADDDKLFEEKMVYLTGQLEEQFKESARLEVLILESLKVLGYGR